VAVIGDASEGLLTTPTGAEGGEIQGPRAGWRLFVSTFVENKLAVVGAAIIVFFVVFCFLGPFVYHTNQVTTNVIDAFESPGKGHPLGTDANGFDELGRMMKGGQAALEIGFFSSVVATIIGTLVGAVAGLVGGFVDGFLMRIVDVLLSIPILFVILIVSSHYGATVLKLSLIIGFFSWLVSARLVRGEVLTLRVIPNALGVVIVNITFQVADSINYLALLGFLGFGLNYPQFDWGDMLSDALNYLQDGYWWLVYPVGICLVLVVMAFNFIGDALRDTVDVRLRRR